MISEAQIDSLTSLFQARYGYVLGAARLYAPMESDIDDIVQQIYLDFLEGALENAWDLQQDVGPLLYQMTKRKAQVLWRKRRRETSRSMDVLRQRRLESFKDSPDDDKEVFQRNEVRVLALRRCLEKLPSKSRAVFEQHYFGGVSMKEISEQQQKKTSTVHQFFFRVRKILRDCIEQSLPDSND